MWLTPALAAIGEGLQRADFYALLILRNGRSILRSHPPFHLSTLPVSSALPPLYFR